MHTERSSVGGASRREACPTGLESRRAQTKSPSPAVPGFGGMGLVLFQEQFQQTLQTVPYLKFKEST